MIVFYILVIAPGVALLTVAILLCLGHINLLHDYHRTNVKEEDKKKLGLSTGLSLMFGALGIIAAGILSIFLQEDKDLWIILLTLLVPLIISIILCIIFVKKYNGSIFG